MVRDFFHSCVLPLLVIFPVSQHCDDKIIKIVGLLLPLYISIAYILQGKERNKCYNFAKFLTAFVLCFLIVKLILHGSLCYSALTLLDKKIVVVLSASATVVNIIRSKETLSCKLIIHYFLMYLVFSLLNSKILASMKYCVCIILFLLDT